jgi:hypothetical protein
MTTSNRLFWLTFLWLHICLGKPAFAQTAQDFLDNYLGPLKIQETPILYAECAYHGGKVVIILPIGAKKGRFVELAWGERGDRVNPALANAGEFSLTSKVALEDLMMGGPGAYPFQTQIVEHLLKMPFTFVYPKDLYSVVGSEPKIPCQPSP